MDMMDRFKGFSTRRADWEFVFFITFGLRTVAVSCRTPDFKMSSLVLDLEWTSMTTKGPHPTSAHQQ